MASNLLKLQLETTLRPSPPSNLHLQNNLLPSSSHSRLILCTLTPTTREEAISQAKLSLPSTLKKLLNNPIPIPTRKLKKLSQPRYRVEIPVVDDSPHSLTQLALEVFANLPLTRKGSKPSTLILWPNLTIVELAQKTFNSADSVTYSVLGSVSSEILNYLDLAVFLVPEASQIEDMKMVANSLHS